MPDTRRARFPWRIAAIAVFAMLIAAALGYYAWGLRAENQANLEKLASARGEAAALPLERQRYETLSQQFTTCTNERDAEKLRCTAAEQAVTSMQSDLSATKAELDTLRKQREETAKRLQAFKDLTARFQKMIDSGKLDVIIRNGQMLVKLPAGVLFDSGSAELSREGELALMEVAIVLRGLRDRKFMVAGHTDNRPLESAASTSKYQNNWELSAARAVTVTSFLIEAKLKSESLVAAGYGQHDPVGDNRTAAGRQENRRIEIVLLPKFEELPPWPEELTNPKPAAPTNPTKPAAPTNP